MVTLGTKVSFVTTTLSYPIFAAEFDPYNRGYLVVGGGGGESRSGVPNKISVLDVSDRAQISTVVDIDLSTDEDSVQSLASLATKDGLLTFAGINSSQSNQNASRNEHFRAFDVRIPPRKRQRTGDVVEKGQATLIGKRSLFKPERSTKKEAYQRLLRLSPVQRRETPSRRIGAVASGMSKPSEIIVFSATTALPGPTDILTRVETGHNEEVSDLDIALADQDRFSVAWCTDYEICEQTLEYDFDSKKVQKTPKGPRRVHEMTSSLGEGGSGPKARFRCVRFLDAENILALVNKPGKSGAELHVYHLYPTGPAATVLQMTLPARVKQAVSMDVCILDSDPSGDRQIVVAVAGQDISIETYVLNYKGTTSTFSRFRKFQSFRDVHQHQMTKVCFSPFHAPVKSEAAPEQFIRMASVSYGNTVVVDSLPLTKLDSKAPSRYVLIHPKKQSQQLYLFTALISFMVLVAAYLGRAYFTGEANLAADLQSFWSETYQEVFNATTITVQDLAQEMQASAASILESTVPTEVPGVQEMQASAASILESTLPTEIPGVQKLQDFLDLHPEETKAIVVRDTHDEVLSVDVHHDKDEYLSQNPHAKQWDDLHEDQKHYWRRKLIEAGRWAESEGETVFKGVLWSQYAGIVGAAASEVLKEL